MRISDWSSDVCSSDLRIVLKHSWGRSQVLASLLLIGALVTTPQMSVQAASQSAVEENDGGMTRAANRTIGGIVSYARWPDGSLAANRQMFVVGMPRPPRRLAPAPPGRGSRSVRSAGDERRLQSLMGRGEAVVWV